jgi:hypothetical protein
VLFSHPGTSLSCDGLGYMAKVKPEFAAET